MVKIVGEKEIDYETNDYTWDFFMGVHKMTGFFQCDAVG